MTRRISNRVAKLESKLAGAKDHYFIAEDHAEADQIFARWDASPFSKMRGHRIFVIVSNMPKKEPHL